MEMKLDLEHDRLLRDFLDAMRAAKARCFLIGAGARVLALDNRWGIAGGRTTLDWDFAVRAASWTEWERLTEQLVAGGRFTRTSLSHRFHHADGGLLDLVPYGAIEAPSGEICWPDRSTMSVVGFQESERQCEIIEVAPGLEVPVAAIPSLALLKLHAYVDRRSRHETKDIQDFDWYLQHYESADNELRIHDELGEFIRGGALDIEFAGAALLGSDLARACPPSALVVPMAVLDEARDPWSRLVDHVLARVPGWREDEERARQRVVDRFAAFAFGLSIANAPSE